MGRAGEEGQRLRLEAAKTGLVTWETPTGLQKLLEPDPEDVEDNDDAKLAKVKEWNEEQEARKMDPSFRRGSADQDEDSKDLRL